MEKTYTESEVMELLKQQRKKCSNYVYEKTYCLRSPTPNVWDKRSTILNLNSIVMKCPIIEI